MIVGPFVLDQAAFNITGDTPLCFGCGLRNFKALAYLYRYDIPPDQLPGESTQNFKVF